MSQTKITSFYNSRKRPATDDFPCSKNKIPHIDRNLEAKIQSAPQSRLLKICDISDVKQEATVPNGTELVEPKQVAREVFPSLSKKLPEQKNASTFSQKSSANVGKNNEPPKAESVKSARKDLSLGDIRKKLAGSSRLAELIASADRLTKGIQDLKAPTQQSSDKSNLKEFKSIDVEVPSSPNKRAQIRKELLSPKKAVAPVAPQSVLISPRKVVVSPVKSPSKVPAYIKYASLATSSTSLPLPHRYRFLAELFRGMETVVALLYNRNEKITFSKLKPSVQEMLKRDFTEKHLAQIKNLVPDFYNFEVKKIKNFATSSKKETFELIISPNLPNDIKVMNPSVLLERRRYFLDTLLKLVKKHHAQYLLTLDTPMVIPDDKLVRWHPEFQLEKVPDVKTAKLPEMTNVEKCSTAQDVLTKARELFKCNTKMERALNKLAQARARGLTDEEKAVTGLDNTPQTSNSTQTNQPSTSGVVLLNPALRNLPTALLEKVRAKQAAKALEAMTRSSQTEEKYMIYSRLPDLAKTMRNIFVTERKNVLALNIILSKLDSSFKANISANDMIRDIKMLTEQAPDLIKLHDLRDTTFVKFDKNADLKNIISKLTALAEKYKE